VTVGDRDATMAMEVDEMSVPAAADDAHEFVVAPELAEVAERLGVPLHAGDRVRFEVIEGGDDGPVRREPWPPAWVDSITTDDEHLAERAREVIRTELGDRWSWSTPGPSSPQRRSATSTTQPAWPR
jgi:hypothetical protein